MNNRPVGGCSSQTLSHPIDMSNNLTRAMHEQIQRKYEWLEVWRWLYAYITSGFGLNILITLRLLHRTHTFSTHLCKQNFYFLTDTWHMLPSVLSYYWILVLYLVCNLGNSPYICLLQNPVGVATGWENGSHSSEHQLLRKLLTYSGIILW
jgi:hypothetical protein